MRRSAAALAVGALLVGGLLAASGPNGTRPLVCAERAGDVPGNVTVLEASEPPLRDATAVRAVLEAASESGDLACEPLSEGQGALRERLGRAAHVDAEAGTVRPGYYVRYGDAVYRVYETALV